MEKGHKPHLLECFPYYSDSKCSFIHYTCNAPSMDVLRKNGIIPLGEFFGCANEVEVLEIPLSVYQKAGFSESTKTAGKEVLTLNLERLMRELK